MPCSFPRLVQRTGVFLVAGATMALAQGPPIAAASDLNSALPEIAALFAKRTGETVRLTFGSSGTLAQQILNGAPFEVFLSADESYVAKVSEGGKSDGDGILYAIGRIGIFVPARSKLAPDSQLTGLGALLSSGRLGKFSIANPDHAPYGRAARDALVHARLWNAIRAHLVYGENVSQATQFAVSGSADGGIIPLSLALTEPVRTAGSFVLIPESWHQPLRQRAILIKGAGHTARAFFDFLQSADARVVFRRYGFSLGATN
jgi:molybdate transport system substrate-binding protein